jgi:TRAP-type uncharacterized transport system substrate-binding protein
MQRRSALTVLAIVLGIAGLVLGAVFLTRMPRTVTLAAGPAGLETHRYAEAAAQASQEARDRIRYKVVTTSGAAESARLLEERKVNLAIVRSDYDLPPSGQTLLVNARRFVIVMAPQLRRGGVQKLADLKGKRVAVVTLTDPNLPLVRRILAVADVAEGDVTLIESDLSEIPELLATNKVDAAIAIVVPSARNITEIVPQIARRLPGGIRFVPLTEADAISARIIGIETADLPAGSFGAGRPKEEIATVAISYRTMANSRMPNQIAGDVAKSLYDLRARVSRQLPVAFSAEVPDAKTGAKFSVHPGAVAFFDGENTSFLERYSDVILTALWGSTLLGSAVSGGLAWFARRQHDNGRNLIGEIAALTDRARKAAAPELAAIEARADSIVAELASNRAKRWSTDAEIEAASLALDHFRSVAEAARERRA